MRVDVLGVWLAMLCKNLGDADAAAVATTEDGDWKTEPAQPWEDSDRDYTYEEVATVHLVIIMILIDALH